MHWSLWYHCSKDTSVFPGVASLIMVLILGVPVLNIAMIMLRRQLTSTLAQRGLMGCCTVLLCPTPPPQKATSPSSMSASLSPPGPCTPAQRETCVGMVPSYLAVSNWTASCASHSWSSSRSWRFLVIRSVWGPLSKGGLLGRGWASTPHPGQEPECQRVITLYGSLVPHLHGHWGTDAESDRLTMPVHGCSKITQCGHHIGSGWKCKDCLCVQEL